MTRALRTPARYHQGEGVVADAGDTIARLDCDRAVLLGGETALSTAEEPLLGALADADVAHAATRRGVDTCTHADIESGAEFAEREGADLVVGVGGGTAVDAAKAVASEVGATFVCVPTVASTDAPPSGVSVVYDDAGRVVDAVYRADNPELLLADTAMIASAPADFLRYGMGDALATRFETEAAVATGATTGRGTRPMRAGLAAAKECHAVIAEHGTDAIAAVERDEVTEAVEAVVEANLLLSALGFENTDIAAAHSLEMGMRYVGCDAPHGLAVAFCTAAQLVLEDHEDLDAACELLADVALDASLADLGIGGDEVETVAEFACGEFGRMENLPVEVTDDDATAALLRADELLA